MKIDFHTEWMSAVCVGDEKTRKEIKKRNILNEKWLPRRLETHSNGSERNAKQSEI